MRSPSNLRLFVLAFSLGGLLFSPIAADEQKQVDAREIEQDIRELEYDLSWRPAPGVAGVAAVVLVGFLAWFTLRARRRRRNASRS